MNIYMWRGEERVLFLNKGRLRCERIIIEFEIDVFSFIICSFMEKIFLRLEIDKLLGFENLKIEKEILFVLKVFNRVLF